MVARTKIARQLMLLAASVGLLITLAGPTPVMAASPSSAPPATFAATCAGNNPVASFLLLRPWDDCIRDKDSGVPRITSLESVWLIAAVVIEDVIKISGYVAVGFILWGAIKYIKSQGDSNELSQAKQIIINAVTGLVIVLVAVAMVQLVAGTFSS